MTLEGVQIQLVGGNSSAGNVFTYNFLGLYGPVCDDVWDDRDAVVVCRYF